MNAKPPDDIQPYSICRRIATDGGRDLTDDDVEEIAKAQPINYRHWPRHAKVSYLINCYGRDELLVAIRRKIDSDESTDRLHKRELAAVTLAMRIQL